MGSGTRLANNKPPLRPAHYIQFTLEFDRKGQASLEAQVPRQTAVAPGGRWIKGVSS